ncbi:DNA-3-methyladenine glycosylase I, partial [Candidatus Bathyarchaeota archaeon]|nr:DNA-3-methyladenine glycosylase I [Candidatus Bathyarchaeota archaeon]
HDEEWGVPVHNDQKLFEFLILEGAQAGLSWEIILKKRENYRRAFSSFNPSKVAEYGEEELKHLLTDSGIVRNRLKIKAAIINAQKVVEIQKENGSFDEYIWRFVHNRPIKHDFQLLSELPANSDESEKMSRDLKKQGFKFVGPTICYAFMQAVGMINDHLVDCFRHEEIKP